MAKRTKSELEVFKNFVDRTYNRFGNALLVNTEKPYDPKHSELGYCYKYIDPVTHSITYKIECSKTGLDWTDYRVMMHEYGHIYLTHLDGIHEELDTQICNLFRDHRGELIDSINSSLGIDFADKLIERVIDDPVLNHSLHNIAMDMEVNSTILSKEDIEEMEMDITSILPKTDEELLKYMIDHAVSQEQKQQLEDALKKMQNEAKIKLILPCRYYLKCDDQGNIVEPFPDDATYAEYLMLIIRNIDQFVKMLVSIQMGGNGDTSKISQRDVQNALNNMAKNWASKSEEYKQGYNDALNDYKNGNVGHQQNRPGGSSQNQDQQSQSQSGQDQQGQGQDQGQGSQSQAGGGSSVSPSGSGSSQGQNDYDQGYNDALNDIAAAGGQGGGMQGLSDLMDQMGMSDCGSTGTGDSDSDSQPGESPYKGTRPGFDDQDRGKDHKTDSRDEADKKRELGEIKAGGGVGCGSDGGPDATRDVNRNVDEVDMALQEVLRNMRNRVVKNDTQKDMMRLYNRGVIRSVIAPTVSRKVTISNENKIVYLIDISGSMDTGLVDRILETIARNMKKLSRGLRYDIITWSTRLGEHIKDIDPKKSIPRISTGGGTSIASGIQYFKNNYGPEAILVVISDFEDYLEEWHKIEETMPNYTMYGFNYGNNSYGSYDSDKINWKYMKIRKFKNR